MSYDEFIEEITDILEMSEEVTGETILDGAPEWDSMAKMSVVMLIRKGFGKQIRATEVNQFKKVEDIFAYATE